MEQITVTRVDGLLAFNCATIVWLYRSYICILRILQCMVKRGYDGVLSLINRCFYAQHRLNCGYYVIVWRDWFVGLYWFGPVRDSNVCLIPLIVIMDYNVP